MPKYVLETNRHRIIVAKPDPETCKHIDTTNTASTTPKSKTASHHDSIVGGRRQPIDSRQMVRNGKTIPVLALDSSCLEEILPSLFEDPFKP